MLAPSACVMPRTSIIFAAGPSKERQERSSLSSCQCFLGIVVRSKTDSYSALKLHSDRVVAVLRILLLL